MLPAILLGELRHPLCRPLSFCKADWYKLLISLSSTGRSDFQQIGFSKVSSHEAAAAVSDCFWGRQRNGSQEEEVSNAKRASFCLLLFLVVVVVVVVPIFLSGRQASKGGVAPPVRACACEEGNQLRRKERRAQ